MVAADVNAGTGEYIGALVGRAEHGSSISDCYVEDCNISGNWLVGGLMGRNDFGQVTDCHSTADVSGDGWVGGLAGTNLDTIALITKCYASGNVSGSSTTGGLVGFNSGTIPECYSTGDVNGGDWGSGLVAVNLGTISNCYSFGNVNGISSVGGLIAYNENTVTNCYSIGHVSGVSGVGGFIGYNKVGSNVTNCFWDTTTSGTMIGVVGTGEPTAQMQTKSTFTSAGWDFLNIWDICDGTNYPKLRWQEHLLGDFICPDGVEMRDFAVLSLAWLSGSGDGNWNQACDISDPNDNTIDESDLANFVGSWLVGVE